MNNSIVGHQVIASINDEVGGPAQSVPSLHQALKYNGVESILHTMHNPRFGEMKEPFEGMIQLSRLSWLTADWSPTFSQRLRERIEVRPGVIHNHGCWLAPNWQARKAARQFRLPLLISPRGMLEPWSLKYRSWKKKIAWRLYEENNLNSATAFHATGEKEARSIEAFGFRKPIYIIPNGVNCHPLTERSVEKNPFVLYLSRIHPKKGIDILLQSWNSISTQFPDWKLIIAGPSEAGYLEKLWEDFPEVRRSNRVIWKKPVYGKEKEELLQAAELVVLPTHSENFGQVVAESLAASTPVITTDQTPWQNLVMKQCGWSIPVSRDALTAALREAMSMTFEQRNEMGREGRQWMISEYSWESRARAMRDVYSFLLSQGSEPESRFL